MNPRQWGPERGPPRPDAIFLLIPPAAIQSFVMEWWGVVIGISYAALLLAAFAWYDHKH